ncbi:zinc finger, CCHC-type containing protein [Tanacetum coccineum]
MRKRMLLFVGGPLNSSKADMEGLGRFLKDKDIAVDVVWFRDTHHIRNKVKKERLEAFVVAVNNNNTSHIAYLEDGCDVCQVLTESGILTCVKKDVSGLAPALADLSMEEDERERIKAAFTENVIPNNNNNNKKKNKKVNKLLDHSEPENTPLDLFSATLEDLAPLRIWIRIRFLMMQFLTCIPTLYKSDFQLPTNGISKIQLRVCAVSLTKLLHYLSDFARKLGSIRGKFKSLGSTLKDKTLVRKLLNSVPKKFLPIVASIEQYSEIDEMSFEEAMGRIITFEERIKSQDEPEENYQNKLLMARSSNQNHGNGRGRNLSKGEKGCGTSFQQSTREQNKNKMRCYECGDLGHFARECTKWKKNDKEEKAHFIYETDDEPTLL